MIKAVIFDVDGVLLHSGAFGARLAREYGFERAALDEFWRGPFARCTLGLADLKEELAAVLREARCRVTVEECLKQWFDADSGSNAAAFEAAAQLRDRGIPCHVGSTQERYRATYLEKRLGFSRHFDRLFFSCHMGVRKPQPEFYAQVTSALGAAPAELLFIDDQRANVEAARAFGWNAELYAFGDDLRALLSRHGLGE